MAILKTTELADKIRRLQLKKKAMESMLDEQIEFYRQQLQVAMATQLVSEVRGEVGYAYKRKVKKIEVKDWDKVWKFAKSHNAPDIFQRRITQTAVEARIAAGEVIDGIEVGPETSIIVVKGVGEKDE